MNTVERVVRGRIGLAGDQAVHVSRSASRGMALVIHPRSDSGITPQWHC